MLKSSLRGRPLDGQAVLAPQGYSWVVCQAGNTTGDAFKVRAVSKAESMVAWNYDQVPSEQDQLRKALGYVQLAKVLHGQQ